MSDGALDSMVGMIPLVFMGGVLMKFTDYAFGERQYPQRRRTLMSSRRYAKAPRRRSESLSAKRARHNRLYGLGDFSNVGF
jgi:hypothetical protein